MTPESPSLSRLRTIGVVLLAVSLLVFVVRAAIERPLGPGAELALAALPLTVLTAIAVSAKRRGQVPLGVVPIVLLGAAFVPGVAAASLEGYSALKSLEFFIVTLGLCLAAVILINTGQRVAQLNRSLMVILVGVAVTALVLPGAFGTASSGGPARQTMFGLNPLHTGRAGSLLAVLAIVALLDRSRRRAPIEVVFIAIGAYLVVASGSRGPVLGLLLALFTILVCSPARARRDGSARSVWVALPVIALSGVLLAPSVSLERILEEGGSLRGRSERYSAAVEQLSSSVFGTGFGDFTTAFGGEAGSRNYAHNLLLEAGSEAGVIALLGLLTILTAAVVVCWRYRATWGQLVLPPLAVATGNALVSGDLNGNRMVLVFAAIAISLGLRERGVVTCMSVERRRRARSTS